LDILYFDWSYSVANKLILKHRLTPDEVEQVFSGKTFTRSHRGVYVTLGKSYSGRLIVVVFKKVNSKSIKIITARDMTKKEKKLFVKKLK